MAAVIPSTAGQDVLPFFRGRGALYHVLNALGIGAGDEVAIQAFTCLAVPLPILQLGARPAFVDADPGNLGMSVEDLHRKIGPCTRAVVVQHTFGMRADIVRLKEVAEEVGAVVIEDCAHVVGGRVNGRRLGSFGAAAFYSYEWGKPVVAGVGGGLVVNDPELRRRVDVATGGLKKPPLKQRLMLELQYQAYRWVLTGRTYWTVRGLYSVLSRRGLLVGTFRREDFEGAENEDFDWRMASGTARRLRRKLRRVEEIRSHNAELTRRFHAELMAVKLPAWPIPEEREAVLMRYPFVSRDKEALLEAARLERIEMSGTFKSVVDPVPAEEAGWLGYEPGSCPVAEELAGSVVSAPVAMRVSPRQVAQTIAFLARNRELLLSPGTVEGERGARTDRPEAIPTKAGDGHE